MKAEGAKGPETAAQAEREAQITRNESALLLEQTGIDIASMAESAGFNASIEIPSETGEYIIHIGQTHKTPEALSDPEKQKRIVAIQKNIEKVLLEMKDFGIDTVFSEGVSADKQDSHDKLTQVYATVRDELAALPATDGFGEIRNYLEKKVILDQIDGCEGDEIATTIYHLCKIRAAEIHAEIKENGGLTPETEAEFKATVEACAPIGSLRSLGDDAIYYIGAVDKLKNEGIFHVKGAETSEGNARSFQHDAEFEAIRQEYLATRDTATPEKLEGLSRKAKEIRQKIADATLEKREDIAVDLVDESAAGKVTVMVYGNDHDFKNNVAAANKDSNHPIGLIKLEPKR